MRFKLGLLICTVFGLVSCGIGKPAFPSEEDAQFVDTSLITGNICEPPCWYGITPGETTIDEVHEILLTLPFVDVASIEELGTPQSWQGWHIDWKSPVKNGGWGWIAFDRLGTTTRISIELGYRLELQESITLIGEPDGLIAAFHPNDPGPIGVVIVWAKKGLSILTETDVIPPDWNTECPLKADSLVTRVSYWMIDPQPTTSIRENPDYFAWDVCGLAFSSSK